MSKWRSISSDLAPEGRKLLLDWRDAADRLDAVGPYDSGDREYRDEEEAMDAWADYASENHACYSCGCDDDTDMRSTDCTTCDPIGAADRAREDAQA
jgi:hypothetical protein